MNKTTRLEKIPFKYRKVIELQMKSISSLIQIRRLELNLTQEKLAEKLELSVMTIQFIEQGRRYPSVHLLIYICHALEINVVFLTPI